jgi:hypothetical protein
MFTRRGDALVLSLSPKKEILLRFVAADRDLLARADEALVMISVTHETLSFALDSFRRGKADYHNACARISDMHIGLSESTAAIIKASVELLVQILQDKTEEELVRGWASSQPPQDLLNCITEYLSLWKAEFANPRAASSDPEYPGS